MKKRTRHSFLFSLLLLSLAVDSLVAQPVEPLPPKSIEEFTVQSNSALQNRNYQRALDLLQEAKLAFPQEPSFYQMRGELLSSRGLHSLALKEYEGLLNILPYDWSGLVGMADVLALLERYDEAVSTYQLGLELYPRDAYISQVLAWLYFKGEEFNKGVEIVAAALIDHPNNLYLYMTMATLQSNMYQYEKGKKSFEKSIEIAKLENNPIAAGTGAFNLSILHVTFHQFAQAQKILEESVLLRPSASAYQGLAELSVARQDFESALKSYKAADSIDETPFSKLGLASLFLDFGRTKLALTYLQEVLKQTDFSWIYNFGITRAYWDRDVHELLQRIYQGLREAWNFSPRFWPWEWAQWAGEALRLEGLIWFHQQEYRQASANLAQQSQNRDSPAKALRHWILALSGQPTIGLKYLYKLRDYEKPLIPQTSPIFTLREGQLLQNNDFYADALEELKDPWYLAERVSALVGFIQTKGSSSYKDPDFISRMGELYRINRGAFLRNGISLPLQIQASGWNDEELDSLKNGFQNGGFTVDWEAHENTWPRLNLVRTSNQWAYTLTGIKGTWAEKRGLPVESPDKLFQALIQNLYSF